MVYTQAPQSLIVLPSVFYAHHLRHIAALARPNGLPAIFWSQQFAEVGGFMAYGLSPSRLWQRAAAYIDKLIKGGKPADLPVEQSTTFELVINLTTAKALGLASPPPDVFCRLNRSNPWTRFADTPNTP